MLAKTGIYNNSDKDVLVYAGPTTKIIKLGEFAEKNGISFRYTIDHPILHGDEITVFRDGIESKEKFNISLGLYRQMLLGSENIF